MISGTRLLPTITSTISKAFWYSAVAFAVVLLVVITIILGPYYWIQGDKDHDWLG